MRHIPILILFLCLITFTTPGCRGVPDALTSTAAPSAEALPSPTKTAVPVPTLTPAPTSVTADNMPLVCKDQVMVISGRFRAENNTWGKGDLKGYSQCIGLMRGPDGSVSGRWTWDWPITGANVRAYPEVIYGQKPMNRSTVSSMPIRISEIKTAVVTMDAKTEHTGIGNTAFDIWLTNTNNPDAFTSPPITHEIMIWMDSFGGMQPAGTLQGQVTIDDVLFNVYSVKNFSAGWTYTAFARVNPYDGEVRLDLLQFLNYMKENGLAAGDEFLSSVEFGNEVVGGTGVTVLRKYQVVIQ